jgi:hypothetical protein
MPQLLSMASVLLMLSTLMYNSIMEDTRQFFKDPGLVSTDGALRNLQCLRNLFRPSAVEQHFHHFQFSLRKHASSGFECVFLSNELLSSCF